VDPGHAAAKECLEDRRGDPDFSPECKAELEGMIERRARDFRVDSRLRRVCEEDILGMCGMFGVGGARRDGPCCDEPRGGGTRRGAGGRGRGLTCACALLPGCGAVQSSAGRLHRDP
jgi:hypothetical protein